MNIANLQAIYEYIEAHPGCNQAEIARAMQRDHHSIYNGLVTLESRGWLLAESDQGQLYPYKRGKTWGIVDALHGHCRRRRAVYSGMA